jgi:ribA/ribD-fused uncharacterized protein
MDYESLFLGDRITDTHHFFWGNAFSNWFGCEIEYKGHTFTNTEQAFMWEKANFFGDTEIAYQILNTPNPSANKALGRKVQNFNAEKWAEVCFQIMIDVNIPKWRKMPEHLLMTGDRIIVEASSEDKIWGIGLAPWDDKVLDEANWNGTNLLGLALMDIRAILALELSYSHNN